MGEKAENGFLLLAGGGFLVAGLVQLTIGMILVMRTLWFLRKAVETTGTIVDLRVEQGESTMYQAVVEFKAHEGKTIRWTQSGWRHPSPGDVGDEIPMKYNPRNPNRARIARVSDMWFVGGLLSFMGLLFGGVGLWLILNMK